MTASVVSWSEFLATDPEVRILFPALRFSEKKQVRNGVHSASWVQLRSYLEETVETLVYKAENTAVGIRHGDYVAHSIRKS
jgi:hypothetical protein